MVGRWRLTDPATSRRSQKERLGPDKRLAETVLKKRKIEIAEGKYLDKQPSSGPRLINW
jgi:hypothetical protein